MNEKELIKLLKNNLTVSVYYSHNECCGGIMDIIVKFKDTIISKTKTDCND